MKPRRPQTGPSQADIRRQLDFMGLARGDTPAPPTRRKTRGYALTAPHASEGAIQSSALALLERDPRVAEVLRVNNGAAYDRGGRFFRFVRGADPTRAVTVLDIEGHMAWGGKLAIEVKAQRSDWRLDRWFDVNADTGDLELGETGARVMAQHRRIEAVKAAHGTAGVIYGPQWDDMLRAILDEGEARAAGYWEGRR